uniref:Transposase n=1 Tax=Oncorhynchus tshawytscha TaxID=74940 RepID=A0AAZ3PZM2_ONCTS
GQKWQAKENIGEAKAKDGENGQKQPTDHLQRPTTSSCCRWCHCALFNNSGHFAQGEAVWESDAKKPFLHTRHKQSRLRNANAHLDKPASFWNKVLWTDETKIELFGHNKGRYAWWQKNTAFQEKHLLPTVQFGGGSIMLWGCVASAGTGNLVKVEGHMDSTQYQQILGNNVEESVTKLNIHRGWIFQQPKNTAQNLPGHLCRGTSTMFWNGHPSPQT